MGGCQARGGRAGLDPLGTALAGPSAVAVAAERGRRAGAGAEVQEAAQVVGLLAHAASVPVALPVAALPGCCCHIGHIGTQGGHEVVAQAGTALLGEEAPVRTCPGTGVPPATPPWWAQVMWLSHTSHACATSCCPSHTSSSALVRRGAILTAEREYDMSPQSTSPAAPSAALSPMVCTRSACRGEREMSPGWGAQDVSQHPAGPLACPLPRPCGAYQLQEFGRAAEREAGVGDHRQEAISPESSHPQGLAQPVVHVAVA